MKIIFIIGYQQKYAKNIEVTDYERLELMRSSIKNDENHVVFVTHSIAGDKEASYIPEDVMSRIEKYPDMTAMIYDEPHTFTNTKVAVDKLITPKKAILDKDQFNGIEIFNLTDDVAEGGNLAKGLKEWGVTQGHFVRVR